MRVSTKATVFSPANVHPKHPGQADNVTSLFNVMKTTNVQMALENSRAMPFANAMLPTKHAAEKPVSTTVNVNVIYDVPFRLERKVSKRSVVRKHLAIRLLAYVHRTITMTMPYVLCALGQCNARTTCLQRHLGRHLGLYTRCECTWE